MELLTCFANWREKQRRKSLLPDLVQRCFNAALSGRHLWLGYYRDMYWWQLPNSNVIIELWRLEGRRGTNFVTKVKQGQEIVFEAKGLARSAKIITWVPGKWEDAILGPCEMH